jgi:hypothetical protein
MGRVFTRPPASACASRGRTAPRTVHCRDQELIAGYWLWEVKPMDEAVRAEALPQSVRRNMHVEIRPLFTAEDFAWAS